MGALTFRIERKTQIVAVEPGGRVRWRWQAQRPLQLVGVAERNRQPIVIVRERLADSDESASVTARIVGLSETTGRPLWQTILERLSPFWVEIVGRLLILYLPNGMYATGVHVILDVRTGKRVLTVGGDLERKTRRELVWINAPGAPPHQNGGTLGLVRLDPQTLRGQRLDLPLPEPSGISFDEHPTVKVRVVGDRIDAIYAGVRKDGSGAMAYFLARYHWSAGPGQKPAIQWLDRPDWPT